MGASRLCVSSFFGPAKLIYIAESIVREWLIKAYQSLCSALIQCYFFYNLLTKVSPRVSSEGEGCEMDTSEGRSCCMTLWKHGNNRSNFCCPATTSSFGWKEDSSGESLQASCLEKITLWQACPVNTFLACVTVGTARVFVWSFACGLFLPRLSLTAPRIEWEGNPPYLCAHPWYF